jgi:hypothetical protein
MLAGLARWLRAAGYDAALAAPDETEAEIVARCQAQDRVLVTRSARLLERSRGGVRIVRLADDDEEAQALALARATALDWTRAPFTRCLVDNAALRTAAEDELAHIPARARALPGPFRACPSCGRLYWPGSHVRRMSAKLRRWADAAARGA